jgi:hypothetical protein
MTIQLSTTVRNARDDAIETAIGASPKLRIYDLTAGAPANCAAAITGTLLAECQLPADWMANAANAVKTLLGTWQDSSADGAGIADFFRIYDNGAANCHLQGTVTATGGGGDMEVDNTNVAVGQQFSVTAFSLSEPNG